MAATSSPSPLLGAWLGLGDLEAAGPGAAQRKCASLEGGAGADASSAGTVGGSAGALAPAVPPPLNGHADTASAGSPDGTPTSPDNLPPVVTAATQRRQQQQQQEGGRPPRRSKRKAEAVAQPAAAADASGSDGSTAPAPLAAPKRSLGLPDLPGFDELDDLPGLDDLLMDMSNGGDALFEDPFAGAGDASLALESPDPWDSGDPFATPPTAQPSPAAAAQALHQGQGERSHMLAQRPLMVNPFASGAAQQQPAAAMVPQQPAMPHQALPAQPVSLERAGSLSTQRSHSSHPERPAGASRKAATSSRRAATQGSKKGGRRDAAPPRPAAPAKQQAQLQVLQQQQPQQPQQLQALQQQQQQLQALQRQAQQLGVQRGASAKPSVVAAAPAAPPPAAAELPMALSPVVFSGYPLAGGLPSAAQQPQLRQPRPPAHWLSHDPSAHHAVKRAATSARLHNEVDAASLKLSPAAALVAAQPAMLPAAAGAGLLRVLFGSRLPASWQC